jgi:hypothetical protein
MCIETRQGSDYMITCVKFSDFLLNKVEFLENAPYGLLEIHRKWIEKVNKNTLQ